MTKAESDLVNTIQLELIRSIVFMDQEKLLRLVKKVIAESEGEDEN